MGSTGELFLAFMGFFGLYMCFEVFLALGIWFPLSPTEWACLAHRYSYTYDPAGSRKVQLRGLYYGLYNGIKYYLKWPKKSIPILITSYICERHGSLSSNRSRYLFFVSFLLLSGPAGLGEINGG